MTPLWILAPTVFANIEDPSALLQIVTRNNLGENMEFIGALNIPLGPDGSEYGGIVDRLKPVRAAGLVFLN